MNNWRFDACVGARALLMLTASAAMAVCSAPAGAQGISSMLDGATQEKLRALVENANGASQSDPGQIDRGTISQVLAALLNARDGDTGQPTFEDVSSTPFDNIVNDAFQGNFVVQGLDLDLPTNIQVKIAFQQGLFGQLGMPPGSGIVSSPGSGLVPPKFVVQSQGQIAAIEQAVIDAMAAHGSDSWANYPYYNAASFTPVIPGKSASFLDANYQATYRGLVLGEQANGEELSGQSRFTMTFGTSAVNIMGNFIFAGEPVLNVNGLYTSGPVNLTVNGAGFQGGAIFAGSATGDFFGPQAEEFGGDFQFEVSGGANPGTTEGQFVSRR